MSDSTLLDTAPCGYLTSAPDGTIHSVNDTFLAWTGYTRDELVEVRTFASLLTAGGRIYHETHYAPMLQMAGAAREIALDIVCRDAHRLPALVNSVLERDGAGAPVLIRTAVFDATHRREYERELLRAKERAEAAEERARLLATTLQRTLIPPAPPDVPGLDVAAVYRPAGAGAEIGGDFYDVFEIGTGQWVIAIGDVQGKGVDAAVVTALVRYAIRAAAVRVALPSEVLDNVHAVLFHHESRRFATVAIVRLDRSEGGWRATVSCGGHPLPILVPATGAPHAFGRPGRLLGAVEEIVVHDEDFELGPGDAIVLHTDGVNEARRGREFYGDARLLESVARHRGDAQQIVHGVVDDVFRFQGNNPRDDIAVIAFRVPD